MKGCAILAFLIWTTSNIYAQAILSEIQFSPPIFFVGDRVELHIEFEVDSGISVKVPEFFSPSEWLEIRDIYVNEDGTNVQIIITFTSFAPGTRTLPNLDFGGIQIRDIQILTHSMQGSKDSGLRRLRGQILVPGTRIALAFLLPLIAAGPFLFYVAFRMLWKWISRFLVLFQIHRPARQFRRLLQQLSLGVGVDTAPAWFAELTDGLRDYLTERTGRDCRSATTAEITQMDEFSVRDAPPGRLLDILKDADMVKFAGRSADESRLKHTLDSVASAVSDWEKNHDRS